METSITGRPPAASAESAVDAPTLVEALRRTAASYPDQVGGTYA